MIRSTKSTLFCGNKHVFFVLGKTQVLKILNYKHIKKFYFVRIGFKYKSKLKQNIKGTDRIYEKKIGLKLFSRTIRETVV